MTKISRKEAVRILNSNGFETNIVNGENSLQYRRLFVGGDAMIGAVEIANNGDLDPVVDGAKIDALIAKSEEMEIEAVEKVKSQPFSKAQLGMALFQLTDDCHDASYAAGWWHHADTGLPYIPGDSARISAEDGSVRLIEWDRLPPAFRDMIVHYWPVFLACKIALIHSEVSEALEGLRKGSMDDKLTHRLGIDAEIADSMIREFDICGGIRRARRLGIVDFRQHNLEIAVTFMEKRGFNDIREDHKSVARRSAGGKYF